MIIFSSYQISGEGSSFSTSLYVHSDHFVDGIVFDPIFIAISPSYIPITRLPVCYVTCICKSVVFVPICDHIVSNIERTSHFEDLRFVELNCIPDIVAQHICVISLAGYLTFKESASTFFPVPSYKVFIATHSRHGRYTTAEFRARCDPHHIREGDVYSWFPATGMCGCNV